MRKKPISDQVVVVTGASSGLGRAIAHGAAARGARVVVTARNGAALDACVREVELLGGQGLAVPADHAVQDEVAQVVEQALDRFGRIDTYVANAMVTVYAEVEQLEPEELRRVLDVNFLGQVYGYWAALPHLRETRGTFVSVNSALAYRGIPLGSRSGGPAPASTSPSSSRARSTRRSSTGTARSSASNPSRCRRSTSRSRSPRRPSTARSAPCASFRSAGAPRSSSGARSSRRAPAT